MGELSKTIGEKGEKLVSEFLKVIGWVNYLEDESITCACSETHKRESAKNGRKTHGIDVFYSFRSNLQDYTLDNVVLSVKYTSEPYPSYPVSKFKEYLKDLSQTVECFMKSNLRSLNNEEYEMSGITRANDVGVLFWLTNHKESDQDVVAKVANINLDKNLNFSTIYIVDNSRAAFIYNSVNYLRKTYSSFELYFHYAFNSSNFKDPEIDKFGRIMPVEYFCSNLLPFRLVDKSTNKVSFCLASREEFSEDVINRLLCLASDVSQDFTGDFIFIFPDYDSLSHERILAKSMRARSRSGEFLNVTVNSYNYDFRNLINE